MRSRSYYVLFIKCFLSTVVIIVAMAKTRMFFQLKTVILNVKLQHKRHLESVKKPYKYQDSYWRHYEIWHICCPQRLMSNDIGDCCVPLLKWHHQVQISQALFSMTSLCIIKSNGWISIKFTLYIDDPQGMNPMFYDPPHPLLIATIRPTFPQVSKNY